MNSESNNLSHEEALLQAAMRWHAATSRSDCDWDAFTSWLEEGASHRQTFNDVSLLEERLARHRQALQRLDGPVAHRKYRWPLALAAAVVMGLAVAVSWNQLPFALPAAQNYQAQVQARPISLHDGSRIVLAPGSQLRVAGRRQDRLELTGSAYFDVPHDPNRPLTIKAGGYTVRDIGTRFEVFGAEHALKVAVGDGEVVVDLPGYLDGVRVTAGHRLLVTGASPVAEYASIPADDVGAWRSGKLVLHGEPLSLVAAQIGLYAGTRVAVDPGIADRRFSGVLAIGEASQLAGRLADIMGLEVHPQGNGVQLSAVGSVQ